MIPRIWNYSGRNTESYAVDTGKNTFYFSYQTCVAFMHKGELYICENVWGTTTGKHLNEINPNHDIRLPYSEFMEKLENLV